MTNWAFFLSLGSAGALACALTIGCSGTDSTNGSAGSAGESAQAGSMSNAGSGTSSGGSTSAGGMSSAAGTSAIAGTSSGGSASSAGTSSAGTSSAGTSSAGTSSAGTSGTNDDCAAFTSEATCKAASNCYPIYTVLPCPNSGGACPAMFSSCADTGCGPSCGAGSVCVGETVSGGAVEIPDAGVCPEGSHLTGQICQRDPSTTFSCKTAPAACNGKITCACTSSLCGECQSAEHNQIDCVEFVP